MAGGIDFGGVEVGDGLLEAAGVEGGFYWGFADVFEPVAGGSHALAQAFIDFHAEGAEFFDVGFEALALLGELVVEAAFAGFVDEGEEALALAASVEDLAVEFDEALLVVGVVGAEFGKPLLHAVDEALGVLVVQLGGEVAGGVAVDLGGGASGAELANRLQAGELAAELG